MDNLETLESDVEDLKKQLSYLTKNVIPELENKINGGSGNEDSGNTGESGNENSSGTWEILYDNFSSDPALNFGLDQNVGIKSAFGVVTQLPDLSVYKKLRFTICREPNYYLIEKDVITEAFQGMHAYGMTIWITCFNPASSTTFPVEIYQLGLVENTEVAGSLTLQVGTFKRVNINTGRNNTIGGIDALVGTMIGKIEGLK